ncbi:hypothetical protein BX666DRAFT_2024937 [Dichotomocladium elegans]|nr:hypothetical protein BX666DRAFT_2024937 [Dichotomocladium elegans]
MSSLVGTSNQEDVPVSGVQTISGLNLNITSLPSRSCNGFNFVDINKGKPDTICSQVARQQQGISPPATCAATATTSSTSTATAKKTIEDDESFENKSKEALQEFIPTHAEKKVQHTLPPTSPPISQKQQHECCSNIPQPTTSSASASKRYPTTSSTPSSGVSNMTFDFTFGGKNGKRIAPSNRLVPPFSSSDDKFALASNFQFSFSPPPSFNLSSPTTTRSSIGYQPRTGNGRSLQLQKNTPGKDKQAMHPLSQNTTIFEDVDQDEVESDSDPSLSSLFPRQDPLLPSRRHNAIPTSEISKYPHLQHRKILPLPKPRWKRQGLSQPSSAAPSAPPPPTPPSPTPPPFSFSSASQKPKQALFDPSSAPGISSDDMPSAPTSYVWQFSASSRDHGNDDWGFSRLSLNEQAQEGLFGMIAVDSSDSSYRDNAKKMKRSIGNEADIPVVMMTIGGGYDERKGIRRRDRKWKNSNNVSHGADKQGNRNATSAGGVSRPFPEGPFEFSENARIYQNLKHIPKLEDMPRSHTSLGLTKILRQTMPDVPPPASLRDSNGRADPQSGPGTTASKKKSKAVETATPASRAASDKPAVVAMTSKRNNKKGQRKKKMDDDHGSMNKVSGSDITLVQSPDPDEWICLFCQYEIFCRGLEAARRKGGYYRRRKERHRRMKEAEARRMGELVASDHEDDPILDDLIPTSSAAPGPPPPPPPLPAIAAALGTGENGSSELASTRTPKREDADAQEETPTSNTDKQRP